MQIVRVHLRQTWFTRDGKRYRGPGEHYVPYDLVRTLPTSATILPDDEHIKKLNGDKVIEALKSSLEYHEANPHDYPDAEKWAQSCRDGLAEYGVGVEPKPSPALQALLAGQPVELAKGVSLLEDPADGGKVDE